MFRRRSPAEADQAGESAAVTAGALPGADAHPNGTAGSRGVTASKGRPTPKRSEAERRRRQPYSAPGDRKEASRQYRDRQRAERARRSAAMQRGEEWALLPRDRGAAKALARDYVDSRRRASEFYMYGLLVLMALLFIRNAVVQSIVPLLVMAAVLIMLVEGIFIGFRVRKLVQERLPAEETRGIRLYAAMRALQIRQLRVPKPRIKPGSNY